MLRKIIGRLRHDYLQNGMVIGYGHDYLLGKKTVVSIPWETANRHTYILGSTGSGKTVLLRNLAYQVVKAGYGLLFIDLKGGGESPIKDIWIACCEEDRKEDFVYLSPIDEKLRTATWNPLLDGDANIVANKLYDAFHNMAIDAQFYEDVKFDVLLKIVSAAKATGKPFTFSLLAEALSSQENLERLAMACPPGREREMIFALVREWKANTMQFVKNTKGTAVALQRLSMSYPAKIVETTKPSLSLHDAIERRKVIYCLLPTLLAKESMRHIAKMLLSEIKTVAGKILNYSSKQAKFFIMIDEFEELVFPAMKDLFNKAREAGISIVIAHQTLSDINYETGSPDFGKSLIDNTATKIIMQTKSKDSAEYLARIIGELMPVPMLSRWMPTRYIVPPDVLMGKNAAYENGLDIGEAIVKLDAEIYRVRIPYPERRSRIEVGKDVPFPEGKYVETDYGSPLRLR